MSHLDLPDCSCDKIKMNFIDNKKNISGGFTLIELLVVIAIIGLLASIVLVNVNNARKKTRDIVRKVELKQLQSALELYFSVNGEYPDTGLVWYSSETDDEAGSNNEGDWIPGLAPVYISKLPKDPRGGDSLIAYCNDPEHTYKSAFLYISNGENYKLLSNCSFESMSSDSYASDAYTDPVRSSWAWMIVSKSDLPPSDCAYYNDSPLYPICW